MILSENMELDNHKKIFEKVLDADDYSELEEKIKKGLNVEKDFVTEVYDWNTKRLQKVVQQLPTHYKKLKKIERKKEKLAKYKPKKFTDCLPVFDPPLSKGGISNYAVSSIFIDLMAGTIITAIGLIPQAYGGLGNPIASLIGLGMLANDIAHFKLDPAHYYHPVAFPAAAIIYCDNKIRNQNQREQKINKKEKQLTEILSNTYNSDQDYTQKWLKKRTRILKQKLKKAKPDFKLRFPQTEKILNPLDKLKLHKKMEKYLTKQCNREKNREQLLEKLDIAEEAGVYTKELKKQIQQKQKLKK